MKAQRTSTTMGKIILSSLLTLRSCFISTFLSFSVVRSFMMGGWISGIRAIYEYAARAMGASR